MAAKPDARSAKPSRLADYAGGVTAKELLEALKSNLDAGKEVHIIIGTDINKLRDMNASISRHSGRYVMSFATRTAKPKIVI